MANPVKALEGAVQDPNEKLAEMARLLAKAEADLAAMKARGVGRITCKVSEKGALSVYGLGRFPLTLYRSQWERLLAADVIAQVRQFISENQAKLAVKG